MNRWLLGVLLVVALRLVVGQRLGPSFLRPLFPMVLTSPFGERVHPVTKERKFHEGADYRAPVGTALYAPGDGVVERRLSEHGGLIAVLKLNVPGPSGVTELRFMHLSELLIVGLVAEGELFARTGATGRVTGPHLHLEARRNGAAIDPEGLFS